MKELLLVAAVASLFASAGALAAPYYEVPDAGQTVGTAQAVSGGTSVIYGNVGNGDADLFSFNWGGGAFYANTVGSSFDSQLFLFDANGVGILGNDDGIAFAGPAYVSTGSSLAAGQYLIGVSGWDYDPYSSSGIIFNSFPYGNVYGPNNLLPLSYWSGGAGGGSYQINFQQITSNGDAVGDPTPIGDVPEPAALGLLGLGLAGLGFSRRRKQKVA